MKHIFIVNPVSGQGKSLKYIESIKKYFEENDGDYEIIMTELPKHATKIASKYTEADDVCLYSIGGDGTAKEVLDGINDNVPMCIIPGGTGNDFYKSVDRSKKSIDELVRNSIEGENVKIDYALLNGTSKFMNVGSFGLDADINVYANRHCKKELHMSGDYVYAYAALKVGLHPNIAKMEVEVDGVTYNHCVLLAAMCNAKYYGGAFAPYPTADLQDGLLDLVIIEGPVTTFRLLQLIAKYSSGKHLSCKEVKVISGKNFKFKFEDEIACQFDGEDTRLTEAEVKVVEKGLTFRMPKNRG